MSLLRFDLAHYRELLEAARAGGYRFAFFDRDPQPGDLLLRHDVDLSLAAALDLAEAEHELGAAATYFLMTEASSTTSPRRKASMRWRDCASSGIASGSTPSGRTPSLTTGSTRSSPGTTPSPRT